MLLVEPSRHCAELRIFRTRDLPENIATYHVETNTGNDIHHDGLGESLSHYCVKPRRWLRIPRTMPSGLTEVGKMLASMRPAGHNTHLSLLQPIRMAEANSRAAKEILGSLIVRDQTAVTPNDADEGSAAPPHEL